MGGTQSTEQGRHGFHVLRVQIRENIYLLWQLILTCMKSEKVKENSPAHQAGIDQFFDYIVGIDGVSVVGSQQCSSRLLKAKTTI